MGLGVGATIGVGASLENLADKTFIFQCYFSSLCQSRRYIKASYRERTYNPRGRTEPMIIVHPTAMTADHKDILLVALTKKSLP